MKKEEKEKKYLYWDEIVLPVMNPNDASKMYDHGYVFTRLGKGIMHQTRSVRVNLDEFELSSENRRILKRVEGLEIKSIPLPIAKDSYDFKLGKMAKDFYTNKFGEGIMSAQKIKEIITDGEKSNYNVLVVFNLDETSNIEVADNAKTEDERIAPGYAICYANKEIIHYSYPFYNLEVAPKDMGLAMMIKTIQNAKENGLKYAYLGSLQRSGDTYKLQFSGMEWFDGKIWKKDLEEVKIILKK